MSSVEIKPLIKSPLDKPFLQYNLDPKTISQILPYFEKNKLKDIPNNTSIISFDLKKFAVYSNFRVVKKKETEDKYTFLIHSGNYYKLVEIYKVFRHINKDLEVFTLEYKLANNYKSQYSYALTLAQKTNFDIDEAEYRAEIRDKIKKYTEVEGMLNNRKKVLQDNWRAEIKKLYDEKNELIKRNKTLYQERLELSRNYYSLPDEERIKGKTQFIHDYREILAKCVKNQNSILEINKKADILERKEGLYTSELYLYNPRSVLMVKSLTQEEYNEMLGLVGGDLLSVSSDASKKEYNLEYNNDLEENELETQISYYKEFKKQIKQLSKKNIKNHKPIINKDLMRQLENI